MPEGKPERRTQERGPGRWAAVHFIVTVLLILAVIVVRLRPGLADAMDPSLLAGIGVMALLLAGLLFRSFLRR